MIASVKLYARDRLKALGYKEWSDGFNFENIPKPRLNETFHLTLGESTGEDADQSSQDILVPFTVRLFRAPSRDPKTLIDDGVEIADVVIADFLKCENRLTRTNPKTIRFNTMAIEPLAESNDNGVIVRLEFTALVTVSTQ